MKILHVNSYYNGSLFYKNLYDKQIERDLDINVFVPVTFNYNEDKSFLGYYTKISKNHKKYDRFIFHVKHLKIYKDIIKKYRIKNFTLIHAHSLFSNGYIALKLKKKYKTPYIVAVRNTDLNVFFKKFPYLRGVGIEILKEAESVIFISENYKNVVINKYVPKNLKKVISKKSLVIPNGINEYWLKNKGESRVAPTKKLLKLLYVGDINKNKNIFATCRAIEFLIKQGYKIEFTIVGKIKNKKIFNKIKKIPFIKYIDPQPKESLKKIYMNNDIFVMPSINETFGLVYAEAMSQGMPVIYTKGQGFDGQFEEGEVGFHVNCSDPYDIAEKITNIITNYADLSENSMKKSERFNWSLIAVKYQEIYKLSVK